MAEARHRRVPGQNHRISNGTRFAPTRAGSTPKERVTRPISMRSGVEPCASAGDAVKSNDEFRRRLAATGDALKAIWPVTAEARAAVDRGRKEAPRAMLREERQQAQRTHATASDHRRCSSGSFERILWQPWTCNLLS